MSATGSPYRALREKVRYHVGWWVSEPFWRLYGLGNRAERVHARIIEWAERDHANEQVTP